MNDLVIYGPNGKYYSEKEERLTMAKFKEAITEAFFGQQIRKI